jgi:hypothetical protein
VAADVATTVAEVGAAEEAETRTKEATTAVSPEGAAEIARNSRKARRTDRVVRLA